MQKKFSKIHGPVVTLNFTEAEALLMLVHQSFKKDSFKLKADQEFVQNLLDNITKHFYGDDFQSQMNFIMKTVHANQRKGLRL